MTIIQLVLEQLNQNIQISTGQHRSSNSSIRVLNYSTSKSRIPSFEFSAYQLARDSSDQGQSHHEEQTQQAQSTDNIDQEFKQRLDQMNQELEHRFNKIQEIHVSDSGPSESNAIPSPGFHGIRRIPVGSEGKLAALISLLSVDDRGCKQDESNKNLRRSQERSPSADHATT
ncbi:unnamed protein product [Adineta ricciae]|uniref:Uncharacterized protein n=1 Tax=Adineta ricciae TaxID=249248 RepID=A0A816FM43_ADIRI|nr:unnamed protein product [Adineta ricciae]CAF1663478.1 unnamed protein product [Adineta ricciae]